MTLPDEYLPRGDTAIATAYGTVYIRKGGREITFALHDSITQSLHHQALFRYAAHLHDIGITRINVDHVYFDWLDRSLSLTRGGKMLDIVYMQSARLFECELKTTREIWLDHTAQQLHEFEKHCENLIVLVPREQMENTVQLLRSINLHKTKVDTYEV